MLTKIVLYIVFDERSVMILRMGGGGGGGGVGEDGGGSVVAKRVLRGAIENEEVGSGNFDRTM